MPGDSNIAPGFPDGYQCATGPLGTILDGMVSNRFPKWGFVIMRGVYDNDAEWNRFIGLLKANVADELHSHHMEDELWPALEWTVVEDRAILENASKDVVRARFREWVETRSVERDGPGAEAPWLLRSLPRFRYCIYVDELCFNTITAWPPYGTYQGIPQWCLAGGWAILIDGTYGHRDLDNGDDDGDEDGGYEAVEGNTNYNVGWAYTDAGGIAELYESLSCGGFDAEIWMSFYEGNRPDVPPEDEPTTAEPLSAVPEGVPYGRHGQQSDS